MRRLLFPWALSIVVACGGRTPLKTDRSVDSSVGGRSGSDGGSDSGGGNDSGGGSQSGAGGRNGSGADGSGGRTSGGAGGIDGTGAFPGTGGNGPMGSGGGRPGSGGSPGSCLDDGDCSVPDACLSGTCAAGSCIFSLRDRDGDGFSDASCGGDDCNDRNPLAHPGRMEVCGDGTDNDCNGVSDCFDPVCKGDEECACVPEDFEDCENQQDDDCDGAVDCNDPECVGTRACGCLPEQCGNGSDDDCDGQIDCEDADCSDDEVCECVAQRENCSNMRDDDCDGRIDCSDPSCAFEARCLCLVPKDEVCADGRDNDCDGLVDCADSACFAHPSCRTCGSEACTGGDDEDCDGLVDCADPSCVFDPACPPRAEACNNERDDDLDGLTDCDDPDCSATPICVQKQNTCLTAKRIEPLASASYMGDTTGQLSNYTGSCGGEAGEAVFWLDLHEPSIVSLDTVGTSFDSNMYVRLGNCEFGREIACDDDSGGFQWSSAIEWTVLAPGRYFIFVDGLTVDADEGPNEGPFVLNVEVAPAEEVCTDGLDNDGDGLQDCADDDCIDQVACELCNAGAPAEAELGALRCTDGLDNDCDGLADCADDDCSASEQDTTECCTGTDQNGNGIADDFTCRCRDDRDCPEYQICYTSTSRTCGLSCDSFLGQLCPFFAPGSECNIATGQCEF